MDDEDKTEQPEDAQTPKAEQGSEQNQELDKPQAPSGEIMDRAQRRALKAQQNAGKKKKPPRDEIDEALAQGKLAEKKKRFRKKMIKRTSIGIGVVLFGLFLIWGFAPFKGGITFGICKVYLETHVRFPKHLRLSKVDNFADSVRIWYTQIDPFGEYRLENIQCFYGYDEDAKSSIIERIAINRRDVPQHKLDAFNKTLGIIAANPPDLTYPKRLPDSLRDLQINADEFRFQVNIPGLN